MFIEVDASNNELRQEFHGSVINKHISPLTG